jgi:ADP-ribose pyrophosphatase
VTVQPWPTLDSRHLATTGIFELRIDRCQSPRDGKSYEFAVIDSPDWVNVIALTAEERVVFVRQYRVGTREVSLEVPGGIVERGEAPAQAAIRELREESGYVAERWTPLGPIAPNPAFQNNLCWSFLAEGCRRAGEPEPDDQEAFTVEEIALSDVPRRLASGEIVHALVAHAFQRLELLRAGLAPAWK